VLPPSYFVTRADFSVLTDQFSVPIGLSAFILTIPALNRRRYRITWSFRERETVTRAVPMPIAIDPTRGRNLRSQSLHFHE
jgi:hypothetical protein